MISMSQLCKRKLRRKTHKRVRDLEGLLDAIGAVEVEEAEGDEGILESRV